MLEIVKLLFIVFLLLNCYSCSNDDELLEKYSEIKSQIESNDYENLIKNLDQKSQEYIELMIDTSQLDYDNLSVKARKYNLEHFSINYLFEFSGFNESLDKKYDALFLYYKLKGIPLFDVFSDQKILEDETKTGKENYVTVARKVNDNTYISKKIKFTKEGEEYKLDFLDLFSRHEKTLVSAVKKYRKKYSVYLPEEIENNELIDSTRKKDFLYTYMHFSRKDELQPTGYYYNRSAAKKRRIE